MQNGLLYTLTEILEISLSPYIEGHSITAETIYVSSPSSGYFPAPRIPISYDRQAIKLITFAEIPTTKDIWNDYMQSESEEVKRLGDNINNVVLKFQVKDNDGKETIDYYRMKPVYEYSIRKINIYKIKE